MRYQTRLWIHGTIAGLISGISNAFLLIVLDPLKFNVFDGGAFRLGIAMILSGGIGMFAYLKEHPLPDINKDIDAVSESKIKVDALTKAME